MFETKDEESGEEQRLCRKRRGGLKGHKEGSSGGSFSARSVPAITATDGHFKAVCRTRRERTVKGGKKTKESQWDLLFVSFCGDFAGRHW